jgi:hypothetical protein
MGWFGRHKILTAIIAVILIIGIAGASSSNKNKNQSANTNSTNTNSTAKKENKTPTIAKIGETARDGKFEFTVTKLECGKTSAGTNQYLTKTPQGQYCFLSLTIKNIGDVPQTLSSSSQYLYNAQNQKYSADDTATLYVAPAGTAGSSWYNNINPGNSVSGIIVFDIPKDATAVTAELHDSPFSSGVKVNLQ